MANQDHPGEASTLELMNSKSANAPATESPRASPEDQDRHEDLAAISGALIGAVERALAGGDADFAALFRAVRLELADDYIFLAILCA